MVSGKCQGGKIEQRDLIQVNIRWPGPTLSAKEEQKIVNWLTLKKKYQGSPISQVSQICI